MNPVVFIAAKRDGKTHSKVELQSFLKAYLAGKVTEYQMSAWLMAAFLNGLNQEETLCMTQTMLDSGQKMQLGHIPSPKVDKHSTGGVGDKLSLIIAPLAAVCGLCVPMISGRGLGHTGGTLDKMESVPGFRVRLESEEFLSILEKHQLAMGGQSSSIAPLDKKLYALRDVTATVEYIPFIAASILSKKLSEGLDALVLDVKTGNGAFMQSEEKSIELARTLVEIGEAAGVKTIALVTDMDQPLGMHIGNWLEMKESIEVLKGNGPKDVRDLSILFVAYMMSSVLNMNEHEAFLMATQKLDSGEAYEKWLNLSAEQGADISFMKDVDKMGKAVQIIPVYAQQAGYLSAFDTKQMGILASRLGAGRMTLEDEIDPLAGIILRKKIGDKIAKGDVLAELHTSKSPNSDNWTQEFLNTVKTSECAVTQSALVRYKLSKEGITDLRMQ